MFFMIAFSLEICYNINKFYKSIYAYRRGAQSTVAFEGANFFPLTLNGYRYCILRI